MPWDADDEKYGRKVNYWHTDNGEAFWQTTAYLMAEVEPDVYTGVNKHTGKPVKVRWTGERYEETA